MSEPIAEVKDRLWIWGHEAGSHNNQYLLQGLSRMTPAEGAYYLDVPNLIMVRYEGKPAPPFDQHAMALTPLKRVVWSIVGAGGKTEVNEVEAVVDLAKRFPNICGVQMDDFFRRKPDEAGRIAVYFPDELNTMRKQLILDNRRLDIWVTLYTHDLGLPNLGEYLKQCDVVTYWTWRAEELSTLEQSMDRLEQLCPTCRKVLGCYMYDYGDQRPMPVQLMRNQCELGLKWLREDRIEGMIFLASCICDLGLGAVEWTCEWIKEVGSLPIDDIEGREVL